MRPCCPVTWSLPAASEAMAPVSVWPGPSGLRVNSEPAVAPAASATTIVSPIAREMARIIAATMPEIAAGTTTRTDVRSLRAPRPYDASRSGSRDRPHRVLGDGRDERDGEDPDADAGREQVEAPWRR